MKHILYLAVFLFFFVIICTTAQCRYTKIHDSILEQNSIDTLKAWVYIWAESNQELPDSIITYVDDFLHISREKTIMKT